MTHRQKWLKEQDAVAQSIVKNQKGIIYATKLAIKLSKQQTPCKIRCVDCEFNHACPNSTTDWDKC